MHYILSVQLSGFYIQSLRRRGIADLPLVIHRQKKVIDASQEALEKGIWIGMGLDQAKTILQGPFYREWRKEDFSDEQRDWLDLCADFSSVIEPDDQHSAYIDLTGHPQCASVAEQLVMALQDTTGLEVVWGTSNSKWLARVKAETGSTLPYLSPDALKPVPSEHRLRLNFLGYRTVAEVAKIPLAELREQFGEDGVLIYQAARGGCIDEVKPLFPDKCLGDQMYFPDPMESRELLENCIGRLCSRLSSQLCARELSASEIRLVLDFESGRLLRLSRTFTKPMQSAMALLSACKLLLTDVTEAVSGVRISLPGVSLAKRSQRTLDGTKLNERFGSAEIALRSLRSVFGDHSIQRASEIEVPRRLKVLKAWRDATGWA